MFIGGRDWSFSSPSSTELLISFQPLDLTILPFEKQSAEWLAIERARLVGKGFTPSYADSEIAAVAVVNQLILVTRNTQDFINFADLSMENWFDV